MQYLIIIKKQSVFFILSFFFLLLTTPSALANKQHYSLTRINKNITVDGVMNEAHWQDATRIALHCSFKMNQMKKVRHR
ncbi:putative membrane associated hydrolase [Pseudoalteromonas sp. JB197]|nr:putative membrane associated hydrolase [Pseudoalteromonas sp. JB197]